MAGLAAPADIMAAEGESTGSFKNFWRHSTKAASTTTLTFVQHEPSALGKLGRRLLNSKQPSGTTDKSTPEDQILKRRQQLYQAQKRHRNRKADYVRSLELEIASLRNADVQAKSDMRSVAKENQAIRDFLAREAPHVHVEPSRVEIPASDTHSESSATVSIQRDPVTGRERTMLSSSLSPDPTQSGSGSQGTPEAPVQNTCTLEETIPWAALDFILALEWPCKDHVHHHAIHPQPQPQPNSAPTSEPTNHALTMTSAVYGCSLPSQPQQDHATGTAAPTSWHLPHAEIERLVELSSKLDLEDDQTTPAQAYAAIYNSAPNQTWIQPILKHLKASLADVVSCGGFGSYVPTHIFFQQLDATIEAMRFTCLDLAGKSPWVLDESQSLVA